MGGEDEHCGGSKESGCLAELHVDELLIACKRWYLFWVFFVNVMAFYVFVLCLSSLVVALSA